MKPSVIGIGLDSADPILLEKWMAQGHLKHLQRLRNQGSYGRLENTVTYQNESVEFSSTEPLWVMFSTGCYPKTLFYWDNSLLK
ncbi:MAG: alkaline phosphatase family protein, partial [Merismopedia sp. SIO2A8]|nr:alkaline phosphatase family protein [Merismopedia sp. SIO2A8]